MKKPIVIIDPLSSGAELAPAFNKRNIPVIAVTLNKLNCDGFATTVNHNQFIEVIANQRGLADILASKSPLAIIPGTDRAVAIADELAAHLTPHYANAVDKALNRIDKALMQQALVDAGIPAIKTLATACKKTAQKWLEQNQLTHSALIIKPPRSAGSDNVFHIDANGDWQSKFDRVLTEPTKINGEKNNVVVIQQQVSGIELAIGTISVAGKHYLSHLIQYKKHSFNGRETIYDYVEFIGYDHKKHHALWSYTKSALDALGIRWGATHTEIMLTAQGPRLIETGARMCGGPVVQFSRHASGSSQADKLVQAYLDGDIDDKQYRLTNTVVAVFLKSSLQGKANNLEIFNQAYKLQTFFKKFLWYKNGDTIPKTQDYLTSLGIIALSGNRQFIFDDYQTIRQLESELAIEQAG